MPSITPLERCRWRGHAWYAETWELVDGEPGTKYVECQTECSRCASVKLETYELDGRMYLGDRFGSVRYYYSPEYKALSLSRDDVRRGSFTASLRRKGRRSA